MNTKKWLKENTQNLKGKYIAVTGATGGIGMELCRYLASIDAVLVFLDRNSQKSENLEKKIKNEFPSTEIHRIRVDMEDFESVKAAVDELKKLPIYAIILNAGAYNIPRRKCSTGFDNVFQINFVSPYYITKQLLPTLEKNSGRVIAVGSIAYNYSRFKQDDIDFSRQKASSKVYGNSKRYLMFSLYRLFYCRENVTLSIAHPGITFTNITSHYPKAIFALIKHPMKVIFMKPGVACLSILKGLFQGTEEGSWIGPRFFNIWGSPKKQPLKTCSKKEADFIFKTAEEIYRDLSRIEGTVRIF